MFERRSMPPALTQSPALTRRGIIVLSAVCLADLMFGLEISSIPSILPTLGQVLHADFKQLQWVMNAYTVAVTTVLMATGTLADRYGRKRLFMISVAAFGLSSLVCGLAAQAPVLIAARFVQGMSGGAMLTSQIAVLSEEFRDGRERAVAWGWWGVALGIGLGFGPIVGGAIVALANWHWAFLIHAAGAVLVLGLAVRGVHESKAPHPGRLDLAGILTLSAAVFCLALYITQGADLGFANPANLVILGLSLAAFVAFLVVETLSADPMFDFSVFRIGAFSGAIMGSMAMNTSYWPFMIYLPIWFHFGLGYDNITAGCALLAYTLPTLVMPPLAERLMLRYRSGVIIPAGLVLIGLGFLVMRLATTAAHPTWLTMLPGCVLSGVGLGVTNTPVTNTTTSSVPSHRAGMASGIDTSARMILLAINIALMGFILASGVRASLSRLLPGADAATLHTLAESLAAGTRGAALHLSDGAVHQALATGFAWTMLYGCVAVWGLAALSFVMARTGGVRHDR